MKVQHHPIDKHLLSIYYVGDSTREQEKVCITRAMLGGREDYMAIWGLESPGAKQKGGPFGLQIITRTNPLCSPVHKPPFRGPHSGYMTASHNPFCSPEVITSVRNLLS